MALSDHRAEIDATLLILYHRAVSGSITDALRRAVEFGWELHKKDAELTQPDELPC